MFQKLVSHNEDIKRLVEKGFAVAFDSGYLIIRDVPYLDSNRALQWGAFVSKFKEGKDNKIELEDHQIFFAGSVPFGLDGSPIRNLAGGPTTLALSDESKDVIVQRSFSNLPLPSRVYKDFFHKIESYLITISGPAMELHGADPFTFKVKETIPDSVFKFHDTMTSRAEIVELSAKFKDDVIAIIGLGGSAAYVLDFLVKTPVKEIRAFDLDRFHVHNAFRSPGRLDPDGELGKSKADVYYNRYENFRHGLSVKVKFIDASCSDDLLGVTFAFVCVDKGSSRKDIFELLVSKSIPFIDVAMGLSKKDGALSGILSCTYYTAESYQAVLGKGYAQLTDAPDDIYKVNIQIAELNALNASLAVCRYKQLRGFYRQDIPYNQLMMAIADLKTAGDPNE